MKKKNYVVTLSIFKNGNIPFVKIKRERKITLDWYANFTFCKIINKLNFSIKFYSSKNIQSSKKNQGQFSLILSPKRYLMLIFVISQEN